MRIGLIAGIALFAASSVLADERREVLTISVGTNAVALTNTTVAVANGIIGKIDEVAFDLIGAGCTGNLTVAVAPELSTMAARNIYTNEVMDADVILRPTVQQTGITGAGVSGVYDKIPLYNDGVKVTWSNLGVGGVTIKATIKYTKD